MRELTRGRVTPVMVILVGTVLVIGGEELALLALASAALVALVATKPSLGAWIYLGVTPLVAGISRDLFLPVLRIHEALLGLIVAGLLLRGLVRMLTGHRYNPEYTKVDVAMIALAATGSLVSMLWRFAQAEPITSDDILYASVFWKYLILYVVFRVAVRSATEAAVSLWVALTATAIVAIVGVLQALGLFGVPELLFTWYPSFLGETAEVGRGASTLALTFAVADVCLIGVAATAVLLRESRGARRLLLMVLVAVYTLGAIAAGQFSGYIGMAVALVALGVVFGELRRVLKYGTIAAGIGALAAWPVIGNRISGFQSASGVPQSWSGRLENLGTFILPRFANGWNIIFGVRPAARVPAPETWRDWVFIESGYLWLVWTGGLPLLISFFYFVVSCFRMLRSSIARHNGEMQAIATGAFVGLWVIVALTVFDPHLTMRGVGDLLFPLLAMAQVGVLTELKPPRRELVGVPA